MTSIKRQKKSKKSEMEKLNSIQFGVGCPTYIFIYLGNSANDDFTWIRL